MTRDDFKLGAQVFEDGSILLKTSDGDMIQKVSVTNKEDLEAIREAAEEALQHLDEEDARQVDDQELKISSAHYEGGLLEIKAGTSHQFVKFKTEDTAQITMLGTMVAEATPELESEL